MLKQQRFDNWWAIVNPAPIEEISTQGE